MAINVTLGEAKPQESKQFPKLMTLKDNGGVFLFISETQALCLSNGTSQWWKPNEYVTVIDINCFTDYNEPITIQNA